MESSLAPETQARLEQRLRDAYLMRVRQQWGSAETLVREALKLAPEDIQGLELLGDLLSEKGSVDEALEVYRKAFALQPAKASLEEKIARGVLQKAEDEHERITAELLFNTPRSVKSQKRNQTVAVLLSTICPGGGQFFNGQYVKGGIFLGFGLLALGFGGPDAMKLFLGMAGPLPRGEEPNGMLAAVGMVGGLIWLASLLDASAQAGKSVNKALIE
jgi:tetratricopeptide (TPR) repeat protein